MPKPLVLAILDGTGLSDNPEGNAVALAKKPNLKEFAKNYLGTKLKASGIDVGVPWGEVGSSEVGHTNIGAGVVLYQNYPRVSISIQDGSFSKIPIWDEAIKRPNIHLIGLLSLSGIHAHLDHLVGLLEMLSKKKYKGGVYIHIFSDGEDAPHRSAPDFLKQLQAAMRKYKIGEIASIGGRYWAMDRSKNWDRVQKFIDVLREGKGPSGGSAEEVIKNAYKNDIEDEMIEPTVITKKKGLLSSERIPVATMKDSDAAIFFNIRPDRARQLTELLEKINGLLTITMTQYSETQKAPAAFPPQYITEPLAKVVSDAGKKQFHIAESEKYAHITYFFNGGKETPFKGEDRVTVPSPKATSYDKKPEMAAREIAEEVLKRLDQDKYDFIAINFANGDMVGHTGVLQAAAKGLDVIDECLGKIAKKVLEMDGTLVITDDHGNCEEMLNAKTGEADTEHSTNPVMFFIIGKPYYSPQVPAISVEASGILADVAPTILEIMNIPKPKEMTGQSLLHSIGRIDLP